MFTSDHPRSMRLPDVGIRTAQWLAANRTPYPLAVSDCGSEYMRLNGYVPWTLQHASLWRTPHIEIYYRSSRDVLHNTLPNTGRSTPKISMTRPLQGNKKLSLTFKYMFMCDLSMTSPPSTKCLCMQLERRVAFRLVEPSSSYLQNPCADSKKGSDFELLIGSSAISKPIHYLDLVFSDRYPCP
jgi:hypothetical protein